MTEPVFTRSCPRFQVVSPGQGGKGRVSEDFGVGDHGSGGEGGCSERAGAGHPPMPCPTPLPRGGSRVPASRSKSRSGLRNDSKHTRTGGQGGLGGGEGALSPSHGQPRDARKVKAGKGARLMCSQVRGSRDGRDTHAAGLDLGGPVVTHASALLLLGGTLMVPFCEEA